MRQYVRAHLPNALSAVLAISVLPYLYTPSCKDEVQAHGDTMLNNFIMRYWKTLRANANVLKPAQSASAMRGECA